MEDRVYTPNSHKYKERQKQESTREKRVEKVVHGSVKAKKRNSVSKFADAFISDDVGNVKSYVVTDILIPAIKNTILDIITDSANMIFGGSARRKSNTPASRVSYGSFFNDSRSSSRRFEERSAKPRYSYDQFTFDHRNDAMDVLSTLREALDLYGQVTVADFYDAIGVTGEFTDNEYGWINLSTAEVIRTREGYVIKLPRALPIEK